MHFWVKINLWGSVLYSIKIILKVLLMQKVGDAKV